MSGSAAPMGELARRFAEFAEQEYRGVSPLYERLAAGVAGDEEILALAARAREGQPAPHLLLAAVHLLLLRGVKHPLARFYPSVSPTTPPAGEDPYPPFRQFCLEHGEEIGRIVATGLVQTNEPRRCAVLLPALHLLARRASRPLAVVEIGASAGLNLLLDRYGYAYHGAGGGEVLRCGEVGSPVQLRCELRGGVRPPLPVRPAPLPRIAARIGVDLERADVRDPEAALWLRALVWADVPERMEVLQRAMQLAREEPSPVLVGDALDLLPEALARVGEADPDALVCVVDIFTTQQLEPDERSRLADSLARWAAEARREVYHVVIEGGPSEGPPQLRLGSADDGFAPDAGRVLAGCDRHGAWLEWREDALAL